MFDKIIFWLTAPLKVLGISAINAGRKAFNRKLFIKKVFDQSILTEMISDAYIRKLNIDFDEVNEIMRSQYHFIDDETAFYNPRLHAIKNPLKDDLHGDHQALRTGSAVWANYDQALINGMEFFFDPKTGGFIRGFKQYNLSSVIPVDGQCVPAMPMSLAFGMIRTFEPSSHLYLRPKLIHKFTYAVNELMKNYFKMGDLSTRHRATATAYDAVFACSLLGVNYLITGNGMYSDQMEKVWKQYRFLLKEPFTYLNKRHYFLDHIIMFGLWSCVKTSINKEMHLSFKKAMRKVYKLSSVFGNPYFAALCQECGCLDAEDRKNVLLAHHNISFLEASRIEEVKESNETPVNWAQLSDIEFTLDQIPFNGQPYRKSTKASLQAGPVVPLNGVVLARSILVLAEFERSHKA